ncbi:MAG TPA: cation transporter [Acidimicrobiales bacterium]|nr:cation transporter [Acidimicrobiales bacterium]
MGPAQATPERRRGYVLQYATIAWNVLEVAVALALGVGAGSLALVAFGLDSLVEVFASLVVIWHLAEPDDGRRRTGPALRLVAAAFTVLALGLLAGSAHSLWSQTRPEPSSLGIVYLAVTAVVMFGLARMKRRAGVDLGSEPLLHEAEITRLDGWLASGILGALAGNALLSWWWADPLAGAAVALLAARQAARTWAEGAVPAAR